MSSPVLWYVTRASGIVALVLLTATTVLGIVTANRVTTARWPGFALQDVHRRVSGVALSFLGLHVLTAVLDTYVHIGWLAVVVPFASPYKPVWVALGAVGVDLLVAVGITSVLRARIGARAWRAVHWAAYLSWPVALAHAFGMGTDMGTPWVTALGAASMAAVAGAAGWRVAAARAARRRAETFGALGRRPRDVPTKHLVASS
jgi:methionine sulfoxide reductase heme-binding subunit